MSAGERCILEGIPMLLQVDKPQRSHGERLLTNPSDSCLAGRSERSFTSCFFSDRKKILKSFKGGIKGVTYQTYNSQN